ncbi:MAG: hypothetical protein L0Z50_15220 [Verrucomicrobiales bacterium]|nr:hypothetical protein [Verrucomicrobiales bacterium]
MKVVHRTRTRRQKLELDSQTFTFNAAKADLDRLAEKALKGELVYIVRGKQRFILQHVQDSGPIPLRPPGYFANCYTTKELELENRFSKASVVRAPKDLE